MAPIAPSKRSARTLRHQRITGEIHPLLPSKVFRPDASVTDSFSSSKQDKRLMKRSSFLSRVASSSSTPAPKSRPSRSSLTSGGAAGRRVTSGGILKKKTKTKSDITKKRRPGKKLGTNLDSLSAALPDLEDLDTATMAEVNIVRGGGFGNEGKVAQKSLKSRKGALKRKERVIKGEMERFGESLARLTAHQPVDTVADGMDVQATGVVGKQEDGQVVPASGKLAGRWAALRGHIASTMEQNPAFTKT